MRNKNLFRMMSVFVLITVLAAFPSLPARPIRGEVITGRVHPILLL